MTDADYLRLAYTEAQLSGDTSTQNGAILVSGQPGATAQVPVHRTR